MSLVVAMALSGLEAEHWNDELREMYEKGTQLLNKSHQQNMTRRFSSSSPGASSIASSYQSSVESGISSLSPTSGSYEMFSPHTQTPFFELNYLTNKKKQPTTVEDIERKLLTESKSKGNKNEELKAQRKDEMKTINYCGRDILDLGNHITNSRNFITPAVIPNGVTSYFENRSQISRLSGAEPPNFRFVKCSFPECGFKEPHYF